METGRRGDYHRNRKSPRKTGRIDRYDSSEKNVIVEEELDCINIDDIGNLEDWTRLVFIDEECGNLIVVNDDGELTRNISQKNSDILQ